MMMLFHLGFSIGLLQVAWASAAFTGGEKMIHRHDKHPATEKLWREQKSSCRKQKFFRLYSQLSQKQMSKDIQSRYLVPLLKEANLSLEHVKVEKLSDLGFSNNVFRIAVTNPLPNLLSHNSKTSYQQSTNANRDVILVAKIFSDLAKKRVDPHQQYMGEIDELLFQEGIGPRILAHTPDALLMEYINGQVLTESMIYDAPKPQGLSVCAAAGKTLGHMHRLESIHCGPNMLWHAMDILLSSMDSNFQLKTDSGGVWSHSMLEDTIGAYRSKLETLALPTVAVGHGDFKLSNVILTNNSDNQQCIRFIDFELSGKHYRGYDLAKFFRVSKQSTVAKIRSPYRNMFWESYYAQTTCSGSIKDALAQLKWEAQLMEPMTWLEAAAFFLSMAALDDPSQKDKWNNLAQSRLLGFEQMKLQIEELN